jgi:predicted nucleic acid-binding Zn ribbon protein
MTTEHRLCERCGLPLNKGKRFCSQTCSYATGQSKEANEKNSQSNRIRRAKVRKTIKWNCSFCFKEMITVPSRKIKFCSFACSADASIGRERSRETRNKIGKKQIGTLHHSWIPDREAVKFDSKLRGMWRGLVRRLIRHSGKRKTSPTAELLGYSRQDLRIHLESLFLPGMTWENHGFGIDRWHIDHIKPVINFPNDTPISEVNALNNLQPLWQIDNLSKSDSGHRLKS